MSTEKPKIEITPNEEQLGKEYWKKQLVNFNNDPTNQNYKDLQNVYIEGFKKATGEGGDPSVRTHGFIDGNFCRTHGRLSDKDLERFAGNRLLAAEYGLQIGPYKINQKSDTASARVTDVGRLQNLITEAQDREKNSEKNITVQKADILELNNLLDRAKEALDFAANQNSNFSDLIKLANEWKVKFPGQAIEDAIVGDLNATKVYKDKKDDKPVIVAPASTVELFQTKSFIERAQSKLVGDKVEISTENLPKVIRRVWKFTRDSEKVLFPEGYYVAGK
jgi:hypothetical protein